MTDLRRGVHPKRLVCLRLFRRASILSGRGSPISTSNAHGQRTAIDRTRRAEAAALRERSNCHPGPRLDSCVNTNRAILLSSPSQKALFLATGVDPHSSTTVGRTRRGNSRIPVLSPGPPTASDPAGFLNTDVDWDSRRPSGYPIQPVPNPSQLASNNFGFFPPSVPSSTVPMNYWEAPPSCERTNIPSFRLTRN